MHGSVVMRGLVVAVLTGCVLGGCDAPGPQAWKKTATVGRGAEPNAAPPVGRGDATVMATVAGHPIYMRELHDLLVRAYGVPMAYQLVADELVRQAAEVRGLTATDAEVDAESDRTLEELFPTDQRDEQREHRLARVLQRRGISYKQWRMAMRRNVLLGKLVEPRIEVTDADVAEEFDRRYGRRVQIRHIQTPTLAAAKDVLLRLQNGADFAELAQRTSMHPSAAEGGLLPPFGTGSRLVPAAVRDVALGMTHVGEISAPIPVESVYHVLKLEKIFPPREVNFAEVKDDLTRDARRRLVRRERVVLLRELIESARDAETIRYVDPVLKAMVEAAEAAP